ncbi:MAG: hypothetical protein R2798_10730 [Chitinophagales bacterium]
MVKILSDTLYVMGFLLIMYLAFFLYMSYMGTHRDISGEIKSRNSPFAIERFDAAYKTNEKSHNWYKKRNKPIPSLGDYYLVSGYDMSREMESRLDSCVCANMPYWSEYNGCYAYFFRKTRRTNNEAIAKDLREYDDYSMEFDRLFSYEFHKGSWSIKHRYNVKGYYPADSKPFCCNDVMK